MRIRFGWVLTGSAIILAGFVLLLIGGSDDLPIGNGQSEGQSLRLYCAAGIRKPVEDVILDYQKKYGVTVEVDYQGSGALLSSIRAASMGDLYLAADISYMKTAREYDLIEEVTPLAFQYPVIAVRKDDDHNIQGLEDLLRDDVRVSLAKPEVAAISRSAKKLIEAAENDDGLWDRIYEAKIVSRDTVNAVANDIKSGTVDAGIVWDATSEQYDDLKTIRVPLFQTKPKQIVISVLSSSKDPTRALHFMRFLSARDKGLLNFKEYGYEVVEGDKWTERPELTVFSGGLNRPAIQETLRAFEEREGVVISDTYNGCGVLVGQIKTGAKPDMYFACDISFMTQVSDSFPDWINVSATEMVIIVHKDNLELIEYIEQMGSDNLRALTRPGLKVGVCHPKKSALGALTATLLKNNGLLEEVNVNVLDTPATADRLVEHVVFQSLEAAIVYQANTTQQADVLQVFKIDDEKARAIQPIAVATNSDYKHLTGRLIDKIRAAESQRRFNELGFEWLGESLAP